MCTSAVLIYITKSFPSCKPLFLKKFKKKKEDSFSPVKPTKIFFRQNLFLTLKMIRAINFTICYSYRRFSINPKFPKPLKKLYLHFYST